MSHTRQLRYGMMYARAKARPQMTFVRGWELELHLGVRAFGRKTERERRSREGGINEDARLRDTVTAVRARPSENAKIFTEWKLINALDLSLSLFHFLSNGEGNTGIILST